MIINNVLIGKEGHLFLHQGGQQQFDYLLGRRSPTLESASFFQQNLEFRRTYCHSRSIKHCQLVYPSKPIICSRFLPETHKQVSSLFKTHYLPYLGSEDCLYPAQELISSCQNTFHKTDTHCNFYGNLLITKIVLQRLEKALPIVMPMEEKQRYVGDLGNMAGISEHEFIVKPVPPEPKTVYQFHNRKALSGNTNDVSIWVNRSGEGRLIIFGDSFAKACLPFFARAYKDVMYIRSSFFHPEIVEMFKPDAIVNAYAERYLKNIQPDCSANNFLMELYGDSSYSPPDSFLQALKAQLSYAHYASKYQEWLNSYLS